MCIGTWISISRVSKNRWFCCAGDGVSFEVWISFDDFQLHRVWNVHANSLAIVVHDDAVEGFRSGSFSRRPRRLRSE